MGPMTFQWTTNQDRNRHASPTKVNLIWDILCVDGRRQTLTAETTVKMLKTTAIANRMSPDQKIFIPRSRGR